MILHHIEGSRLSEVKPLWRGLTAVVIGCGPSLTRGQVARAHRAQREDGLKVIAVNDAYLWAPWADVAYAADSHWHKWHTDGIDKYSLGLTAEQVRGLWASFAGQKCTIETSGGNVADANVHMLQCMPPKEHGMGLSRDSRALVTGYCSGFQAVNLAVLSGVKRILLLGFDAKQGANNEDEFHDGHPRKPDPAIYPLMRKAFRIAAPAIASAGVHVVNCTPGSAIDDFVKMTIDQALRVPETA